MTPESWLGLLAGFDQRVRRHRIEDADRDDEDDRWARDCDDVRHSKTNVQDVGIKSDKFKIIFHCVVS